MANYEERFEVKYTTPQNVEVTVLGEQKLTGSTQERDKNNEKGTAETIDDLKTDENLPNAELSTKEIDSSLTTVYTVTKNEEIKVEEIQMNYAAVNPLSSNIYSEVTLGPHERREDNSSFTEREDKFIKENKKLQTKIPKFRQTAERVQRQRKDSNDKNSSDVYKTNKKDLTEHVRRRDSLNNESHIPIRTGSEKENLTSIKTAYNDDINTKGNEYQRVNNEVNNNTTEPEEEFDKIYEEIIDDSPTESVIKSIIVDEIEDPKSLEISFEEIIHDYEENKVRPIDVSKRQLSKQNSLHNNDTPKSRDRRYSLKDYNDNDNDKNFIRDKNNPKFKTQIPIRYKEHIAELKDKRIPSIQNKTGSSINKDISTNNVIKSPDENTNCTDYNNTNDKVPKNNNTYSPKKDSNINASQSKVPDSTKLVQNILSNMDPKSAPKEVTLEKTITISEDKERIINKDNESENETNDEVLNKIKETPRRRSLKSRIAVLIRRRSMEAKNKIDKGDLYPKDAKNGEYFEPSDRDIKETKQEQQYKPESNLVSNEKVTKIQISPSSQHQNIENLLNISSPGSYKTSLHKTNYSNQTNHGDSNNIKETPSYQTADSLEEQAGTTFLDNVIKDTKPNLNNTNPEGEKEEPIPILKGRVNRIINRLDSRQDTTKPTVDIRYEIPVKKSVSSRIAMFEQQSSKESVAYPALTKKTENKYKPRIISEVLKRNIQKPNEIRVEDKKRQSVIIDVDTASNYVEESYISGQECSVTDETIDQTEINNTSYLKDKPIENSEISQTRSNDNETLNLQESKDKDTQGDFNIDTKTSEIFDVNGFNEKLDTHTNIKEKSLISVSKPEANLTKHRREEKSIVKEKLKRLISETDTDRKKERSMSVAEIDLGNAVKGKVHQLVVRMNSREDLPAVEKRQLIRTRDRPRSRSVSEKIALFERKLTPVSLGNPERPTTVRKMSSTARMTSVFTEKPERTEISLGDKQQTTNDVTAASSKSQNTSAHQGYTEEEYLRRISELVNASAKYGRVEKMSYVTLNNGVEMPVLALGTALLNERLLKHVIEAAIDLGYRAIDTAYIYGNEEAVGEAIQAKIDDGTVTRADLFIINKLWSTFHRTELVETACRDSLRAMKMEYFDLYLVHNPMSFKEGGTAIPRIANVLQYSDADYLDAWYGMEGLVTKGLVKSIGVSNFNATQVTRVAERARIKPVINQVECHPYLTQLNLENVCKDLGIKLCCFGILGSKGTPSELKAHQTPVIDDPMVKVMAAGLNVTPGQLLVRYQMEHGRAVVVKASSAHHLWDTLGALNFTLSAAETDALDALNRNKRTYAFKGSIAPQFIHCEGDATANKVGNTKLFFAVTSPPQYTNEGVIELQISLVVVGENELKRIIVISMTEKIYQACSFRV